MKLSKHCSFCRYEFSGSYASSVDSKLLPSKDTRMSLRLSEYSRRSGTKGSASSRSHRSHRRGMRERLDLRDMDKDEDTTGLKMPSRKRVWELKSMAAQGNLDEGKLAWSGYHSTPNNESIYQDISHTNGCYDNVLSEPVDLCSLHDSLKHKLCFNSPNRMEQNHFDDQEHLHGDINRIESVHRILKSNVDSFYVEHDQHESLPNFSEGVCTNVNPSVANETLCQMLTNMSLTNSETGPYVHDSQNKVTHLSSDALQLLTIETPMTTQTDDVFSGSPSESQLSCVMYYSEGDWSRDLEGPPEEEEMGMGYQASGYQPEEERKEKEKKSGGHRSKSVSSVGKRPSATSIGIASQSHQQSTADPILNGHNHTGQHTSHGHRSISPNPANRTLATIQESGGMQGKGTASHQDMTDSAQKTNRPSMYQLGTPIAVSVPSGGKDENQNKTGWKSVLQTNLSDRLDTGVKEESRPSSSAPRLPPMGVSIT